MISMYFFYNWFKENPDANQLGVTFAYANKIKNLMVNDPNNYKKKDSIQPVTKPLKYIFCTEGSIIDEILSGIGEDPNDSEYIKTFYPNYIKGKFELAESMYKVGAKAAALPNPVIEEIQRPSQAKFYMFKID